MSGTWREVGLSLLRMYRSESHNPAIQTISDPALEVIVFDLCDRLGVNPAQPCPLAHLTGDEWRYTANDEALRVWVEVSHCIMGPSLELEQVKLMEAPGEGETYLPLIILEAKSIRNGEPVYFPFRSWLLSSSMPLMAVMVSALANKVRGYVAPSEPSRALDKRLIAVYGASGFRAYPKQARGNLCRAALGLPFVTEEA